MAFLVLSIFLCIMYTIVSKIPTGVISVTITSARKRTVHELEVYSTTTQYFGLLDGPKASTPSVSFINRFVNLFILIGDWSASGTCECTTFWCSSTAIGFPSWLSLVKFLEVPPSHRKIPSGAVVITCAVLGVFWYLYLPHWLWCPGIAARNRDPASVGPTTTFHSSFSPYKHPPLLQWPYN